ncbi:MAG: lytic transglycosylase domain-containing protein [Zetaproteobacteria bacterium]|nr:lytic transglycosylase domain-containing protein [Zetaproteobacteria bacterium]
MSKKWFRRQLWFWINLSLWISLPLPGAVQPTSSHRKLNTEILTIESELARLTSVAGFTSTLSSVQVKELIQARPDSFRNSSVIRFYQGAAVFLLALSQTQDLVAREREFQQAIDLTSRAIGEELAFPGKISSLLQQMKSWNLKMHLILAENQYLQHKYREAMLNFGRGRLNYAQEPKYALWYAECLRQMSLDGRLEKFIAQAYAVLQPLVRKAPYKDVAQGKLAKKIRAYRPSLASRQNPKHSVATHLHTPLLGKGLVQKWRHFVREVKKSPLKDYRNTFSVFREGYLRSLNTNTRSAQHVALRKLMDKEFSRLPPALVHQLVVQLWKNAQVDQAILVAEAGLQHQDSHPDLANLAYDLGRLYEDSGNYGHAEKVFERFDDYIAGTKYSEDIFFRKAWVNYLRKKRKKSPRQFADYLKRYPQGKYELAAKYYSLRPGKKSAYAFMTQYPFSYYTRMLTVQYPVDIETLLTMASSSEPKENGEPKILSMGAEDQFLWSRFAELSELGLQKESTQVLALLDHKMQNNSAWNQFLVSKSSEFAYPKYQTISAMRLYQQRRQHDLKKLLYSLYPRFMYDEIQQVLQSTKSPLSYPMVVSLIRQESAFQPDVKSSAGALGLMQLMPATARITARRTGKSSYNLRNPQDNLFLGVSLLNHLWKKYDGKWPYVLSAYNAGEKVTDLWIRLRGKLSEEKFVESIPYLETRKYIQLIQRNVYFYSQLEMQRSKQST